MTPTAKQANLITRSMQFTAIASVAAMTFFAIALMSPKPSFAGDFGGACCADLEERIAELESFAARKGNRKMQLTVSGQVDQGIMYFDDGGESNIYQVANSNSSDRFRFNGRSRINKDLTAGYYLELGLGIPTAASVDQNDDNRSFGASVRVRQSLWYLRSKNLGSLTVGLSRPATDNIISYSLGRTSIAGASDTTLVGTNLFTRDSTTSELNSLSSGNTISLRWRRLLQGLDTRRGNLVRYDTPVMWGFTVSAAWGEDDFWDIAIRHTKKYGNFRFVGGLGYFRNVEEGNFTFGWPRGGDNEGAGGNGDTIVTEWKGSASLLHMPTGLFASAAYVHREFSGSDLGVLNFACFTSADATAIRGLGIACDNRPDFQYVWVNAGIRKRFTSLGTTTFYGEYGRANGGVEGLNVSVNSAIGGDIDFVTKSEMDIWGVGAVQQIRAANMDVFLSYRHFSADVKGLEANGTLISAPIEDADIVFAGSRIRF